MIILVVFIIIVPTIVLNFHITLSLRHILLLLFLILPLILRTWISNGFHLFDKIISQANNMYFAIHSITAPSDVSVKRDVNIVLFSVPFILNSLPSICEQERVV